MMNMMNKIILTAAAAIMLASGAQATEVFNFVGRLENGNQHSERPSASAKPARKAPPSQPARSGHTTYKLRTGEVVKMSESQYYIANHLWRASTPQEVARNAARITVMIIVQKNDGTFSSGTGFFLNHNQVLTNY